MSTNLKAKYPQHLATDELISIDVIHNNVAGALAEDLGITSSAAFASDWLLQDVTAQLIAPDTVKTAHVICRDRATIAGCAWVAHCFELCDPNAEVSFHVADGDIVEPDTLLFTIKGNARALLTAERTALNFLQMLSATATQTAHYVDLVGDNSLRILDTRKTIPHLRLAQKYAVQCGGGQNHRIGLYDAFLIKENHIFACGGIAPAISQARHNHPELPVEVEVENLDEFEQALEAGADIVMLDNFSTKQIQEAVALNDGRCKLEVSGNITAERIEELSSTGVDFISSGALTKNILAVDLSLRIID